MRCDAKLILASESSGGDRLLTLQVMGPRSILAQINTHRTRVQSAQSHRAIPTKRAAQQVVDYNFDPIWKYDQSGMDPSDQSISEIDLAAGRAHFSYARRVAVRVAKELGQDGGIGFAKGISNRLLEPFAPFHAVITMSTKYVVPLGENHHVINPWEHLFSLRCAEDAQDEFQELANKMRAIYESCEWIRRDEHLPYVKDEESRVYTLDECLRISSARCARTSYFPPGEKKTNVASDLRLAEDLIQKKHTNPLEHPSVAAKGQWGPLYGWKSLNMAFLERYMA